MAKRGMEQDANQSYLNEIDAILTGALGDRSTRVSQDALDRLATWPDKLLDQYDLYVRYYNGDQRVELTDRLKQFLERNHFFDYSENYCEVVVEQPVSRLKVVGVSTSEDPDPDAQEAPVPPEPGEDPIPGGGVPEGPQVPPSFPTGARVKPTAPKKSEKDSLSTWLWEKVWDGSQGDQIQIEIHREAMKKGETFLVVDYDHVKDKPVFVRNSPENCRVIYRNGVKELAVKKWETSDKSPTNPQGVLVCRMNVYYPDRIEKWFRLAKAKDGSTTVKAGWVEWLDDPIDGEPQVWPTPWVADDGETPLGIPVFHFANAPDDHNVGRSELRNVIPQQDRLNKELVDLSAVLDSQGAPQRWAVGTNTAGLVSNPGEVWSTDNENAKFGQFEAADPVGLLKSVESTIVRIADRSRTPRYLLQLSGGAPSGEALKTSEAGFVSKVEDRQVFFGNQWSESLRMAASVAHIYGSGTAKPPVDFDTVQKASINIEWKDAETRNEKEHLETLGLMKALGIPDEELWARIDGIDVQAMKEKKQQQDVENAATMMQMFDRGGDTNPPIDGQGKPLVGAAALARPKPGPFGAN